MGRDFYFHNLQLWLDASAQVTVYLKKLHLGSKGLLVTFVVSGISGSSGQRSVGQRPALKSSFVRSLAGSKHRNVTVDAESKIKKRNDNKKNGKRIDKLSR